MRFIARERSSWSLGLWLLSSWLLPMLGAGATGCAREDDAAPAPMLDVTRSVQGLASHQPPSSTPTTTPTSTAAFTVFESGQVRPLALSASRRLLYVTNTPDNRVEIRGSINFRRSAAT